MVHSCSSRLCPHPPEPPKAPPNQRQSFGTPLPPPTPTLVLHVCSISSWRATLMTSCRAGPPPQLASSSASCPTSITPFAWQLAAQLPRAPPLPYLPPLVAGGAHDSWSPTIWWDHAPLPQVFKHPPPHLSQPLPLLAHFPTSQHLECIITWDLIGSCSRPVKGPPVSLTTVHFTVACRALKMRMVLSKARVTTKPSSGR